MREHDYLRMAGGGLTHDKLKIGRQKEKEVFEILCYFGIIKAYWMPPRAKFFDQDIYGVFDGLCIGEDGGLAGVQVCRKRPAEVNIRKKKLEGFARRFMPAMRMFVCSYTKDGFFTEELMPSMTWRLMGVLPWAETPQTS